MPGSTTTGAVLEAMVLPALRHGGYTYEKQVYVGPRLGGGRQVVDVVASRGGNDFLISMKWQQVSGTAEQKVPFEAMCLAEAVSVSAEGHAKKAYLVLGGPGWKLRDFFINGGLDKYLRYSSLVDVVTLEDFIARANAGQL